MWLGLILMGLRGLEVDPLPWSGPTPSGWWGREASGAAAGGAGAMLHGVINLLTQGSAGTLWRVARCLAFCQPTNPLTRPEHALLTTPRSQILLTMQLMGLSRGWDMGAAKAPEGSAYGLGSLCRPTFQDRECK